MKLFGLTAAATSVALALFFCACSGGGSSGSGNGSDGGAMYVQTCSLGCSSGQAGDQVTCSIVETYVNQELTVLFSQPIDESSVTSTTFQLINANTGETPVGTRFVDPTDPHKLVFRPAIDFSTGIAHFGFDENATYRITIPGQSQGDIGPFIESTGGRPNTSRLQCDLHTSQGVVDPVPGKPSVTVKVDVANLTTANPNDVLQPALDENLNGGKNTETNAGDDNVSHISKIGFIFNDLMNPSTLADPITHQPSFISILIDLDGNLDTDDDQESLFGEYFVTLDLDRLETRMTFISPTGIPSTGALGRKVLINLPASVQDLDENPIEDPRTIVVTPELIVLEPVVLPTGGEHFVSDDNHDIVHSSAAWGSGRLTRGYGGGSGRLGELHIKTNQIVTLNTDSQVFPLTNTPADILDNASAPYPPATITITDGVFEFSSVVIENNAKLVLKGLQPARVYSRGAILLQGNAIIDLTGESPVAWNSLTNPDGEPGGLGGPNAGDGGKGGDRADNTTHPTLKNIPGTAGSPALNGIDNPGAVLDGAIGGGVGRSPALLAAGKGGHHNPENYPIVLATPAPPVAGGLTFSDNGSLGCEARQVGAPGGGGGYGSDGGLGVPKSPSPLSFDAPATSNIPASTAGGDSTELNLENPDPQNLHVKRRLEWELGNLRGGSGGGGGSGHLFGTTSVGTPLTGDCIGLGNDLASFLDHSGAGGGGGGGALHLTTGRTMFLNGRILAQGGNGGNAVSGPTGRESRAMPGGGGSGGAVRLQAVDLEIAAAQGRVDVSGGLPGTNLTSPGPSGTLFNLGSGGAGSAGLVRLEEKAPVSFTRETESPKIFPFDPLHVNMETGLVETEKVISVGSWAEPRKRPESYTGAISCWMKPGGDFFVLNFNEDDPFHTDAELQTGWNMDVLYDSGSGEQTLKYRGTETNDQSPFFPDAIEAVIPNEFNFTAPPGQGSYFAVRFQGAKANGDLDDPCDVSLFGSTSDIATGSLTPWVRHPAELNEFNPRPNMVRFTIVFDRALTLLPGSVGSFIKGVTNLRIHATPD